MLKEARKNIDRIDQEILKLLEKRMNLVEEIVLEKRKNNQEIFQPQREEEVINRVKTMIQDKKYEKPITQTFQAMMDFSKEFQKEKMEEA